MDDDLQRMLDSIAATVDGRLMAIGARTAGWEATDWSLTRLFQLCATDREIAAVGTRRHDREGNELQAEDKTGTQRVRDLAMRMKAIREARDEGGAGDPPLRPGDTEEDSEAYVRSEPICVV